MFQGFKNLTNLKFNDNASTLNLEIIDNMFDGCESLLSINTKIFKINKVKNLNYVFRNCHSLTELDL